MALSKKPSLGLQPCINKLGVQHRETNLLDSVTFLRNKIVAHQDDLYRHYSGPKVRNCHEYYIHILLHGTSIISMVLK